MKYLVISCDTDKQQSAITLRPTTSMKLPP